MLGAMARIVLRGQPRRRAAQQKHFAGFLF
jgi:hypothetical protein